MIFQKVNKQQTQMLLSLLIFFYIVLLKQFLKIFSTGSISMSRLPNATQIKQGLRIMVFGKNSSEISILEKHKQNETYVWI